MNIHPIRILFVCYGNICRSPTAECVLRSIVAKRLPDSRVEFDSAGTSDMHTGKAADARTRAVASARGYNIDSLARGYTPSDLDRFDLILAMDRDNLGHVHRVSGTAEKVRLFSYFLDDTWPTDVPDPFYGGTEGFDYVLDMIEASAEPILEWVKRQEIASGKNIDSNQLD
jgi:protein-tyrosine phosphatase